MNKRRQIAGLLMLLACASAQSQAVARLPAGDCSVMSSPSAIQNVRSAEWLGPCKDGLADGVGQYSVDFKSGSKSQYVGQMQNGRPNGGGKTTFGANVLTGDFVEGRLRNGKVSSTDGRVIFEGTLNPNGTFKSGKYYIGEAWLEGEFLESGLPDPFSGANIRSGTYFEKDGIPWYTFENGVKRDLQAERRAAEVARYQQAEAERRQRDAQTTAILQAATQLLNAYAQRSQGSSAATLATGDSGRSPSQNGRESSTSSERATGVTQPPYSQPARNSSSSGTSQRGGQSFVHPQTGQQCVSLTGAKRTTYGNFVEINFQNICDRIFRLRVIASKGVRVRGGGISPGNIGRPSTSYITCRLDDGCEGGEWYFE